MPRGARPEPRRWPVPKLETPNTKQQAWPLFDTLVSDAPHRTVNPWTQAPDGTITFEPDYHTLARLLAVPILLSATSTSGVPALAYDVWAAYELRRGGLNPDWVWPRATAPRVIPRDVLNFIASLPIATRKDLNARLLRGSNGGVVGASANLLGKNYVKQVDVVVSAWETGPELLISTKRMDSSFGNNAANRIEESYGDAKNLRLRYPQAACGFVYGLRSTCWTEAPAKAPWLVDLLTKLGQEDDAYHACALVVPEWAGDAPAPPEADPAPTAAGIDDPEPTNPTQDISSTGTQLNALPHVELRHDLVPAAVEPGRFFKIMVETLLKNSPIDFHQNARVLRSTPREKT